MCILSASDELHNTTRRAGGFSSVYAPWLHIAGKIQCYYEAYGPQTYVSCLPWVQTCSNDLVTQPTKTSVWTQLKQLSYPHISSLRSAAESGIILVSIL